MPKKAGLFRSLNSLFELNTRDFLLREPAKFSVWRIPGTREFRGEQSKIRVSPFLKQRKMPLHSMPDLNHPVSPFLKRRKCSPFVCQTRTVPCHRFGFDKKTVDRLYNQTAFLEKCRERDIVRQRWF